MKQVIQNIFKRIVIYLMIITGQSLHAQNPAISYTLNSEETASKTYTARDEVKMLPGFSFSAGGGNVFKANIDAGLLFPPTENTYALPDGQITTDPTQGAVVGSIPGQFAVSPSGAATYTIPIEVPAGINGMQPSVSIGYSSQAGYGTLGTGWNINGISAITRGGKNLYFDTNTKEIKFDNSDALYLDGQRLIQLNSESVSNLCAGAIYGTEVEDYARVEILTNSDNKIYFQITKQNGEIFEYGKTDDSRIESLYSLNSVTNLCTLSWKLNKVIDAYGNYIDYSYYKSTSRSGDASNNLISKIEYGGNSIEFSYIPNNTYDHTYKVFKVWIGQSGLLESIKTKVGSTTLKNYQFVYNNQDKLTNVKLSDGNDIMVNSSIINWGNPSNQPEFMSIGNVANANLSNYLKGTSSVDFADINGDGYNDRVERWIGNKSTSGFINVYFYNCVTKTYSSTISTSQQIAYADYEEFKQQFIFVDINNDGKDEIVYTNNNNLHILSYNSGNLLPFFTDGRGAYNTESILEIDEIDVVKITAKDVNSDGYADIIFGYYNKQGSFSNSGNRGCAIFYGSNNGLTTNPTKYNENPDYTLDYFDFGEFFDADGKLDLLCLSSEENIVQPSLGFHPIVNTSNDLVQITTNSNWNLDSFYELEPSMFKAIDFDKDGLSDILFLSSTDNKWRFVKNKYGGIEGNPISDDFTVLPFSRSNCQFIDLNGDGLVDVVEFTNNYKQETIPIEPFYDSEGNLISTRDVTVYDNTSWRIYINIGDGKFNTPIELINYFETKLITSSDINYDGISDLIIIQGANTYALTMPHANHQNLVTSVKNGMGLTESVSYKNITEYQPNYPNEVNEKVRPLRAPLLVVDNHTHIDGSKTVYSFEAPQYHTHGKGFLGFTIVKTNNVDNNVKSTSTYGFKHYDSNDSNLENPYYFSALTSQSISTIGGENNITYSSQTNTVKEISNTLKRYIPYVKWQVSTDALKNLTQTTEINFNNFPDSLTQIVTNGDLTTTTVTTFTGPSGKTPYLPATIVSTRTQNGLSFTKRTDYSFIFDGTNPYKITEKTETIDPVDVNSVVTTYSNFDPWGHPQNISISANGKTRTSKVKYYKNSITEDFAGLYLRSKTNTLEETTNYNWNENTGLIDSETDPRGNTTTYNYASFGQLQETVFPDGLRKASTLQWAGSDGVNGAKYYSYSESSGSAPVIVWYDGLGRAIKTDTYGLNEKKKSVITEYYTENDFTTGKRKGMVYRTSEPYFEADANNKIWAKTFTYDEFGRTVKAIIPMGELTNKYELRTTTVTTPESKTKTTINSAGQILTSTVNDKIVTYEYYPSGLVKSSTPQDGLPITMAYNKQGKQTRIFDPNSGLIRSEYNGFGELTQSVQKVHATGDSIRTINTYKTDGRLESINRNGEITTYSYSANPNFQNRIYSIELRNNANQVNHKQTFTYDPSIVYDRVTKVKEEIKDNNGNLKEFLKNTEYDELGRIRKEVLPSGYSTINKYDRYSNLTERTDGSGKSLWKVVDENAKGQSLHITKGNKTTSYKYYNNGKTEEIKADNVVDMYYEYESQTHNLHSREDKLSNYPNQKETFGYDALNRLNSWSISINGTNTTHTIEYDSKLGTIKSKSDLGAFTLKYGGEKDDETKDGIAGGALPGPHALTSITPNTGATGSPLNISAVDLLVSYTDFKKISTLTEGSKFYRMTYGVVDERIKSEYYTDGQGQGTPALTRYYLGNYEEEIDALGNVRQIHYLSGAIMIRTNGVETLYYSYADFQGSLIALTDADGNIVQRYAYDPWGVRRKPDNWTEKDSRPSWIVNRGYTEHEHLDQFSIINMNGRVYDPLTAQFFSPDPILTDAGNWLDYNRFGYCLNNPFRYTDPTGYTWWAENGNMVITTTASIVVGGVVAIATAGGGIPAMITSGMAAGAAGGFTGGAVGTALAGGSFNEAMLAGLQGAAMGAVTGGITAGIGSAFGPVGSIANGSFNIWKELGRAGVHSLAQGGFSYLRGGDFWQGAAAGFAGSFVGSAAQGVGIDGWGMVGVSAASGGIGAAIAGGEAEDILFGMVSGAMVGMLNHRQGEVQKKKAIEDAQLKLKAILELHGIVDNSVDITSEIIKGIPTISVLLRSGGSLANLGTVLKQFKASLGPIGFTLNELSDFGKLYTGEYNGTDFMQSTALNLAASTIPAVAVTMVFIWAIHTEPVPAYYQNPVCPKDNTNYVIKYLSH